jgi:hypothetical protein
MVKKPNLQDSSCCPNSIPEMEILEKDCIKFLDEHLHLSLNVSADALGCCVGVSFF